jgi:hypothetical protein
VQHKHLVKRDRLLHDGPLKRGAIAILGIGLCAYHYVLWMLGKEYYYDDRR